MADMVAKSVRLMDKEVRLYPRVKLEDIVKSVAADGTETVVKLVEQNTTVSNVVYGTSKVINGNTIIQASLPYSEAANGGTIAKRDNSGRLNVADPTETPQAVNLGYVSTHYGSFTGDNDWIGINRFDTGLISVHATDKSIYMKLTESGFSIQKGQGGYHVELPDEAGTLTTQYRLESATTTMLSRAESYTDQQINAKLSSVLKYKGSKDTYADLPKTGNQVGDVWNVVAAYGNAHAGTNWAWNGTIWDPLGGAIDLTNYVTAPAAFTTAGMIVVVNKVGSNREIKESTYAPGPMTVSNHPANMLPTAQSVFEFVTTRTTELGQSISLKVDKKTTAGEYAYVHKGATQAEYKLYGGLSTTIPGGAVPYTSPDGKLATDTIAATFIAPSPTSLAITVPDTALKQALNGQILKSLVTNINGSLTQINNYMITYEEVS